MRGLLVAFALLTLTACGSTPERAGQTDYLRVCATCHGSEGQGIGILGSPLTTSEMLAWNDDEIVEFLKKGRMPKDPDNKTGMLMPPRGGDPRLTDEDLQNIVTHMRFLAEQ